MLVCAKHRVEWAWVRARYEPLLLFLPLARLTRAQTDTYHSHVDIVESHTFKRTERKKKKWTQTPKHAYIHLYIYHSLTKLVNAQTIDLK